MVSERNTSIGVCITVHTRSSGHIMADTQTIAVYHSNACNFDFGSCFTAFSVESVQLINFERESRSQEDGQTFQVLINHFSTIPHFIALKYYNVPGYCREKLSPRLWLVY